MSATKQWFLSNDLSQMLSFAYSVQNIRWSSPRLYRYFAIACCRIVHGHTYDCATGCLKYCEDFADGAGSLLGLQEWRNDLSAIEGWYWCITSKNMFEAVRVTVDREQQWLSRHYNHFGCYANQCADALRDILIYPNFDTGLKKELSPTAKAMAKSLYRERNDDFSIREDVALMLADLLEDEDAADVRVVRFLKTPGRHFRGWWPLDLLLGKS